MDFGLSDNQQSIRDAIQKVCAGFEDAYWLKKDREGGFPKEFHRAMADGGWLGICVPEKFGGAASASPRPRSSCVRCRMAPVYRAHRPFT